MHDTLETIIDEIVEHDHVHPDHGVGCACHDKHAGMIRRLVNERMLNVPDRQRSLMNLIVVLSYFTRNP